MADKLDTPVEQIDTKDEIKKELDRLAKEFKNIESDSNNSEIKAKAKSKKEEVKQHIKQVKKLDKEKIREIGQVQKQYQDFIKNYRKDVENFYIALPGSGDKILKNRLKLAEKLAQENIDRQVLLSKLASLEAFDKTSKEFQADLMRLISGSGISTSLIANIYNKQNRRQYLDPIYETARKDDYALYTQLQVLENACIVVDNQGNYSYKKPYYTGNSIYPGQRNPKTGPQGRKKNVVVDFVKKGLDYTKMTEAQKEGWSNAAFIGGAGLGLFMIGKWLFTKGKDGKGMSIWGKLGTMAAVVFGTQALTGMNPLELISKAIHGELDFGELYGGTAKQYDKLSDDMKKQSHGYLPWTMAPLFGGMTLGELHKYVKNKDGKRTLPDWKNNFKKKILGEGDKLAISRAKDVNQGNVDDAITKTYELLGIKPGEKLPDAFKDMKIEKITRLVEENKNTINKVMKEKNITIKDNLKLNIVFGNLVLNNGKTLDKKQVEKHIANNTDKFVPNFEKIGDLDNQERQNTIDAMKIGDELVFKINGQEVKLSKENSNLRYLKSFKGQHIRKINANDGSINGLENQGNPIKFIDSKTGETDYKDLFETAHKFNILEKSLTGKVSVGKKPFVLKGKDIIFKESVQGGKVNEIKIFDGSYITMLSDFPKALEEHKPSVVEYLNKNITTTPTTQKTAEQKKEEAEKKKEKEKIAAFTNKALAILNTGTGLNLVASDIVYDEPTKKITISEITSANVKNPRLLDNIQKLMDQRAIWDPRSEKVKTVELSGVDYNTSSYSPKELEAMIDIDGLVFGPSFEKMRGKIQYLIDNDAFDEDSDITKNLSTSLSKETINSHYEELLNTNLGDIHKKIEEILFNGIDEYKWNGVESYDLKAKKLTIQGLNEKSIQNDQLFTNLKALVNQDSWYNPFGSELVEKVEIKGIDLKPGNTISMNYLEKMLDLEDDIFTFSGWFSENREMVKRVSDRGWWHFDTGNFYSQETIPLDMNGIILLDEIYRNDYDFNGLGDKEDDSRADFVIKLQELLAKKSPPMKLTVGKNNLADTGKLKNKSIDYARIYNSGWWENKSQQTLIDIKKARGL